MGLEIVMFPLGRPQANCIILADKEAGECVIVDPGLDSKKILKAVTKLDVRVLCVLLTHGHLDHAIGAGYVRETFDVPVIIHKLDIHNMRDGPRLAKRLRVPLPDNYLTEPDRTFSDNDVFMIGSSPLVVLHTPGHSPGSCCFYLPRERTVITGDTLTPGRLPSSLVPGGSYAHLRMTLRRLRRELPPDCRILYGHGPHGYAGRDRFYHPK